MSKIVILGSAHPFRGGLASYNERLALEYQREGHEVIVYTFSLQYPSFLFPGKTQYSESPKPNNLDIRVRVNSTNPLNWLNVGNEIKNLKPDLLIVKYWLPFMGPCFGTICRIVKRNRHTKVVSILDNVVPHEKRIGDETLTKYFIGGIDAAVAMSQSVLDDFKMFAPTKPVLLSPHPAFDNFGERETKEQAKQHLNIDSHQPVLLFFGFIRDYKGLDWLLQAIAKLKVMQLNFKLLVAGEFYTDAQRYLDLIQQLNLQDKVILHTHFINDENVKHYFCAADMVVQPYKHATQSGVTQICYHFERPMLVTRTGGLPEIVPDGKVGYVVEPNVDAISNAILDFYNNNREGYFATNIAIEKQRFTWDKMVRATFEASDAVSP